MPLIEFSKIQILSRFRILLKHSDPDLRHWLKREKDMFFSRMRPRSESIVTFSPNSSANIFQFIAGTLRTSWTRGKNPYFAYLTWAGESSERWQNSPVTARSAALPTLIISGTNALSFASLLKNCKF